MASTNEEKEIVYYVNEDRELVCTYVTYAEYREMERVHEGFSLMIHALWDFGEQLKLPEPIPYAETTTREWCHQHDEPSSNKGFCGTETLAVLPEVTPDKKPYWGE